MNTDTPRTDCIVKKCDQKDAEMAFAIMTDHADCLERELTAVTAQRDRLADSLCSVFNLIDEDPQSAKDLAETTLQSLTPKEA